MSNPALHAEAKAKLPELLARTQGCGIGGVRDVIGRRLATFPQPDRSDAEWAAWWADYFDVLSDLPFQALECGMKAYVASADAEFMPKPGRLREHALKAGEPIWRAASRAKRAALMPPREIECRGVESVELRRAVVADALATIRASKTTNQVDPAEKTDGSAA